MKAFNGVESNRSDEIQMKIRLYRENWNVDLQVRQVGEILEGVVRQHSDLIVA